MKHFVVLNDKSVMVDGVPMQLENQGMAMLNDVYRSKIGDYPKFFKIVSTLIMWKSGKLNRQAIVVSIIAQ